jgi:hypothetical protein
MKASFIRFAAALAAGVGAFSWNAIASADNQVVEPTPAQQPAPVVQQPAPPAPMSQSVVVAPQQPAPVAQTTTTSGTVPGPVIVNNGEAPRSAERAHEYAGPNRTLLMSGIIVMGVPYLASVGVAASSNHTGDDNLYVPVIGPWLDLGHRGDCPAGSSACDNETANKLMIGADGVLQAIGALQIVGSFVFPETRSATTVAATKYTPAFTLTPAKMGKTGYGLTAFASF